MKLPWLGDGTPGSDPSPAPDEHTSPEEWECRPLPVGYGRQWDPRGLVVRARAPGEAA